MTLGGWLMCPPDVLKCSLDCTNRGWMSGSLSSLHNYWSTFTDKFTGLWDSASEEQPTSHSEGAKDQHQPPSDTAVTPTAT